MQTNQINPSTPATHHRFHFLDALRGIAAILVVSRHAPFPFRGAANMHSTYLAVDFFFCLSGFVVAFSYERRLGASMTLKHFALVRMIRLYPMAALGSLLGSMELLYHAGREHLGLLTVASTIFMGFALLPFPRIEGHLFALDLAMWTLFFELLANFAYAALARTRLGRNSTFVAITVFFFLLLVRERIVFHTIDGGVDSSNAILGLARVGFSFFTGVLLLHLFRLRNSGRIHSIRAVLAACTLTALFVAALCSTSPLTWSAPAEIAIVCLLFPGIVYAGAFIVVPARWIALCALLGNLSYTLYILHLPLLWPLNFRASMRFGELHPNTVPAIMFGYLAVLVVIASLIAEFCDVPLRRHLTTAFRSQLAPTEKLVNAQAIVQLEQ